MRAEYDSTANAISIVIAGVPHADQSDEIHRRGIVALADGKPIEVHSFIRTSRSVSFSQRHPLGTV